MEDEQRNRETVSVEDKSKTGEPSAVVKSDSDEVPQLGGEAGE